MMKDLDSTYIPQSEDDPIRYFPEGKRDLVNAGWNGPGWYYWDDFLLFIHGPFCSKEEALKKEGRM